MKRSCINNFKGYIALHLHLDGSLDVNTVKKLMEINGIKNNYAEKELIEKLMVREENEDLNEYLSKFDFPISLLQKKEAIEYAMYSLKERLKKDGLIYAEIRFAPQFFTAGGLSQEEAVKAVISGNNKSDLKTNIILCLMRGNKNKEANLETIQIAKKYYNKGICAVDLAGAEGLYPTETFKHEFELVKEYGIPFTIHAGEASGAESVKSAINFGAFRIGHGVNSFKNDEVLNLALTNHITYEVCPKSNLDTKAITSVLDYNLRELLAKDVYITINTDNLSVSNTNISNEFNLLNNAYNLTNEEFKQLLKNSVKAAFISNDEKQLLLKELEEKFTFIDSCE